MKGKIYFFILLFFLGATTLKAQNCQADFQYSQNGTIVNFLDSSINTSAVINHNWSFGDGNFSTFTNPTHTYSLIGQYNVCLFIYDSICNDSICKTITISVPNPCTASFTYSVSPTNDVSFISTTSPATGLFYSWDFGDGSPLDTIRNPTHTYNNSGVYIVQLTATGNGQLCVFKDTLFVNSCVTLFSHQVDTLGSVQFFNQSITSLGGSFDWDFGDGNTSNQRSPTHQYAATGFYGVTLNYIDTLLNCSSSFIDSIAVFVPQPCQAGFTYQVNQNMAQFTSTASNFIDISYSFGDGNSSNLPNPTHTYTQSGSYIVCQKVTDSLTNCTATFCDTIQISIPQPCQAGFTYFIMGDSVLFQSTASNYTRLTYYFGDGDTSNLDNPIHIYATSNQYTVTQIVYNDSTNCTDTIVKTIWATNSGTCVANYQIAIDTTIKTTLFLINRSSNSSTHRYDWDFGDGTVGTGRIPTHQYADNIAYKICLTVSDSSLNCISTYCDSVGLDTTGNLLKSGGFFLKVLNGGTIGIEETDLDQLISVYPNPVQSQLTIESNQKGTLNYQLFGIDGVAYRSGVISMETIQLSLSDLSRGVYFLRLTDGKQLVTKKIIKQ